VIRRVLAAATGVLLCAAPLGAPAAVAQPECGPDQATALGAFLVQQQLEPNSEKPWGPIPLDSNFDPCADLSAVLLTVESARPGSPVLALLFHRGQYIAPATLKPYRFTTLNRERSTPDTVVLDYATAGDEALGLEPKVTSVRFAWVGDHVQMLDPGPPV